jgi:hypothetical protein
MKYSGLILLALFLLLIAGCTNVPGSQPPVSPSSGVSPVTSSSPVTSAPAVTSAVPTKDMPVTAPLPPVTAPVSSTVTPGGTLTVATSPDLYTPVMSSTIGIRLTADYPGNTPVNYSWETNYGTFSSWDVTTGNIDPYSLTITTTGNVIYWTFPANDTGPDKPPVTVRVGAVDRLTGKVLAEKAVYIGWADNFTAVVMPAPCGGENCHGPEISCGRNVTEICTMQYMLGDKCRALASCRYVNGSCTVVKQPGYDACVSCTEQCNRTAGNDPVKAFDCESRC